MRYGRPLWAAYYDSVVSANKVGATISLARKKLLGGEVLIRPGWVTREIAVSVFAALIGLDVVAWATLPQELAARHMRSIIRISPDRKRVYTASAAEPALAAAAAQLLHRDNDAYLDEFLSRLIEVCIDGLVLEGVRGEMVARIVLILAMHQLTKDTNYIKPVSMRDFLSVLFEDGVVEALERNCCSLDVELFFNCFLPTNLPPTSKKLDEYFERCAAMVNRRNERVVDLCLPGKDSTSGSNPTRINPPRAAKKARSSMDYPIQMCLPGQVKNRKNDGCVPGAAEMLDADERFINQRASVLFQIGSPKSTVDVSGTVLLVHGLDFALHFLNEGVVTRLKQLASTHVDVFNGASELERALVERMVPLAYRHAADNNEEA